MSAPRYTFGDPDEPALEGDEIRWSPWHRWTLERVPEPTPEQLELWDNDEA